MRKSQRVKLRKVGYSTMLVASLLMAVPTNAFAAVAEELNAQEPVQQEVVATTEETVDSDAITVGREATEDEALDLEQHEENDEQYRCTGIYVGGDLTESGDTFVGRDEDLNGHNHKVYEYVPAQDNDPEKDFYVDIDENPDIKIAKPKHTFGYTCYHDDPNEWDGNPENPVYAACGINDNGVAITSTVSIYPDAEEHNDPYTKPAGLAEDIIGDILLSQATSPKHACELAGKLIDEHGSAEGNQFFACNGDEAWIFSVLSGHNWIAFKLPKDKISVNPNIGGLQFDALSAEDVMYSANMEKHAVDSGFAKYYDNGNFNPFASYGEYGEIAEDGTFKTNVHQLERLWQGYEYFTDSKTADKMMEDHPLFFDGQQGKKYSTFEVLRSLAYRGAGTKYDATLGKQWYQVKWIQNEAGEWVKDLQLNVPYNEKYSCYSIGNMNNLQEHFFQLRHDKSLPEQLRVIQWESLAPAEWNVFLPLYNGLITDIPENYQSNDCAHSGENSMIVNPVAQNDVYYTMNDLNRLAGFARAYGADMSELRANLDEVQQDLINQQQVNEKAMLSLDPSQYTAASNKMLATMTEQLLAKVNKINDRLRSFILANTDDQGNVNLDGKKFELTDDEKLTIQTAELLKDGKFDLSQLPDDEARPITYGYTGEDEQVNPEQTKPEQVAKKTTAPAKTTPQTGDTTNVVFPVVIAIAGASAIYVSMKKREQI